MSVKLTLLTHPSGGNASPGTINGVHHTYQELIVIAITQSANRCLTLAGIYQWMLE
jgi:hypothetical protein